MLAEPLQVNITVSAACTVMDEQVTIATAAMKREPDRSITGIPSRSNQ
jgi:hypothetical protein